jgi:hypothetical protein
MTISAVRTSWQQDLAASGRRVSAAVVGGLVSGALVGGLGGRLAMLVLRITSDDYLRGLETDDGFVMGQLSLATLFLVIFTSVLGVFGALFYLAVRAWLPEGLRVGLAGLFGGIVGGAAFIQSDGIDFRLLEPLPLAIVLFIALPAAYGVAMSVLVERSLRADAAPDPSGGWWALALIPLFGLALIGPIGLGALVLIAAAWVLHRSAPGLARLWGSATAVWIGRAALLALTTIAFGMLVRDVTRVL